MGTKWKCKSHKGSNCEKKQKKKAIIHQTQKRTIVHPNQTDKSVTSITSPETGPKSNEIAVRNSAISLKNAPSKTWSNQTWDEGSRWIS